MKGGCLRLLRVWSKPQSRGGGGGEGAVGCSSRGGPLCLLPLFSSSSDNEDVSTPLAVGGSFALKLQPTGCVPFCTVMVSLNRHPDPEEILRDGVSRSGWTVAAA